MRHFPHELLCDMLWHDSVQCVVYGLLLLKSNLCTVCFIILLLLPSFFLAQYGWSKQDLKAPTAGRGGSDITKFAAELIKNGIYY